MLSSERFPFYELFLETESSQKEVKKRFIDINADGE